MHPTHLIEIARAQIERARAATSGRSAHTVHGGHETAALLVSGGALLG